MSRSGHFGWLWFVGHGKGRSSVGGCHWLWAVDGGRCSFMGGRHRLCPFMGAGACLACDMACHTIVVMAGGGCEWMVMVVGGGGCW